ncbi:28S ribosomal protein S9, mitochondrial-like [Paramacrobiotus metropolitanus]|uniref:28S ribosomal protein S9, mitochondrial-like n=1 Tax=Paramacrobiotus metropolitanus TaxID=2943436 RepID=UPI0024463DCE|nr:28S ribosomal protein S9, mitochondrial-like [Paramacrobiotus metropolitanus]
MLNFCCRTSRLCSRTQSGQSLSDVLLTIPRHASNVRGATVVPSENSSSAAQVPSTVIAQDSRVKISKAMRSYLERAQAHNMFMKQQTHEFEIGKRHLANMMGEDPETFTQKDVDRAIAYLLPSNLSAKGSRPVMKPPEEIFPQQKEAQFGLDGRPFHPLFYTLLPNYYQAMHDISEWIEQLNKEEDDRVRKGKSPIEQTIELAGTEWVPKEELAEMFLEKIDDHHYRRFIMLMDRLLQHPYAFRVQEFVMKFRRSLIPVTINLEIPQVKVDEDGRKYAEAYGHRKTVHCWVQIKEGTGKIDVNGYDILYFPRAQNRLAVMFPFQFLNQMYKFDLKVSVKFGATGEAAQASAIREAVSKCLAAFATKEEIELMRQAGLLTHDRRIRERKKYGFMGARAKPRWRKR